MSAPVQRVVIRRVRSRDGAVGRPPRDLPERIDRRSPSEPGASRSGAPGLTAPTGILIGVAVGALCWLAVIALIAGLAG